MLKTPEIFGILKLFQKVLLQQEFVVLKPLQMMLLKIIYQKHNKQFFEMKDLLNNAKEPVKALTKFTRMKIQSKKTN